MTVQTTALKTEPKTARTRRPRAVAKDALDTVTAPPKPKTAPATTPKPTPKPTPKSPKKLTPKTQPARRPAERSSPGRSRSAAAERAYARRAHREGRTVERAPDADRSAGRASFVILIIGLLTVGVAATLWLSTQAIADSYRLEEAKEEATHLAERAAELQREVTKAESASSLAERAKAMGMVPAGDPARLVVQPDGTVVVVGEPTPAQSAPPAEDPATSPADQAQTPDGQAPVPGGG